MAGNEIKLKSKAGSPVKGKDEFFDREKESHILLEKIRRGNSVYISAPRRIGKTSLMFSLQKTLTDEGNICLFYDLEGYSHPSDWVCKLAEDAFNKSLSNSLIAVVKNLFGNLGKKDATLAKSFLNSEQWKENGENFIKSLVESCQDGKRVVIFLDELGVMIQNMQDKQNENLRLSEVHADADAFLAWLRSLSMKFGEKLTFVIASSIGLPPLLRKFGISKHINHLVDFKLEAWTHEIASECIRALARGSNVEFSEEAISYIIELVGWCSPYYVQLFVDTVRDYCKEFTCEEIKRVYQEKIVRGNIGNYTLSHMEERLRKIFTEKEYVAAMDVLSLIARNKQETSENEIRKLFDENKIVQAEFITDVLEHDGYIERGEKGWGFVSNILRDWWIARYRRTSV